MAAFDQGGGCACGLYRNCRCESRTQSDGSVPECCHDWVWVSLNQYICDICGEEDWFSARCIPDRLNKKLAEIIKKERQYKMSMGIAKYILLREDNTYKVLTPEDIRNTEIWSSGRIFGLGPEQRLKLVVEPVNVSNPRSL